MKNNIIKAVCLVLIFGACMISPVNAKNAPVNDFWVGTFQLTWNDLMDKIVKGPVEFLEGNPKLADELNKQNFKADMLSPDSYYKICAKKNKALKAKIEKDIWAKFHEKSDILDKIDWTEKREDAYFLYAMLKKEFEFLVPFKELKPDRFANSWNKYRYFGIDSSAQRPMKKNVTVLFYNNANDYAASLKSTGNEEVILYRTDKDGDFEELFKEVKTKTKPHGVKFKDTDTLKVPFVEIDKEVSYDELCGKEIKNTDRLYIKKALQTVQFSMDNKGGKLKSEAAMDIATMSLEIEKPRNYNFDKKFVLFLKENNKEKPYFALKVYNTDYLVKK